MSDEKKTDDLAVLFPDREIEIAGEKITVREFRYREGLEAAALARPFLAGLRALLLDTSEQEIAAEAIEQLQAEHADIWMRLVALSCGKPVEWLAQLPDKSAMEINSAFWQANAPFFMRRLVFGAAFVAGVRSGRSRSRKSSPTSSEPDSAPTSTTSVAASPGASSSAFTA